MRRTPPAGGKSANRRRGWDRSERTAIPAQRSARSQSVTALWLPIVVAVVSAVLLRFPHWLFAPRLWAEEGSVYLASAAACPWWLALVQPHQGYYSFAPNFAAVIAWNLLPLEAAPRVTFFLSFLLQLAPLVVLLSSGIQALQRPLKMFFALVLVLVAMPSEEIWLNTTGSPFFLALSTAIVLATSNNPGIGRWWRRLVIGAGALSGLPSVVLAPLFVWRATLEKDRERWLQTGLLCVGGVVQGVAMAFPSAATASRAQNLTPDQGLDFMTFLGTVFAKQVLLPFLGADLTDRIAVPLGVALSTHTLRAAGGLLVAVVGVGAWLAVLLAVRAARSSQGRWLILASVVLLLVSFVGSLESRFPYVSAVGGGRYFYAPNALLSLALAASAVRASRRVRVAVMMVLTWIAVVGAVEFTRPREVFRTGPDWSSEVRRWRADPQWTPTIWPAGWPVSLPTSRPPR
jgi:hypothetical protein